MNELIRQFCMELGFDAVGITTADPVDAANVTYFRQWLDAGCAAKMAYLHRNIDKRFDPGQLLKGARSVICVALNYRPAADEIPENPTVGIARFAQYEDYHPFIKDRLFQLAEFIKKCSPPAKGEYPKGGRGLNMIKFKACVDSVPIAERALAQRAGLGFFGKNHMLINPEMGSQFLLGELITTLELEPDEPLEQTSCGDCNRCIRACPTGALNFDGTFDSRKCISYLTIEKPLESSPPTNNQQLSPCQKSAALPLSRGSTPKGGGGKSGEGIKRPKRLNYIFGCDECILACPHELKGKPRKNTDFQFHPEWQKLTPETIQNMTEDEFQETFANSAFIRLGLTRLKRNCLHTKA